VISIRLGAAISRKRLDLETPFKGPPLGNGMSYHNHVYVTDTVT